jgi:hypothetical protein
LNNKISIIFNYVILACMPNSIETAWVSCFGDVRVVVVVVVVRLECVVSIHGRKKALGDLAIKKMAS